MKKKRKSPHLAVLVKEDDIVALSLHHGNSDFEDQFCENSDISVFQKGKEES